MADGLESRTDGGPRGRTGNAAALVQGIVLVTFPALSTIFTSKSDCGLSS
jgi:hypothetical protein